MVSVDRASFWRSAAAGVASVLAGVGAGEIVSAFFVQNGSPVLVVGALVIDLVPAWLKDAVISLFGTGDKVVLVVSLAIVLLVGAAVAGWLEWRRPPLGRILIGVGGAVGVLAALTRVRGGLAGRCAVRAHGGGRHPRARLADADAARHRPEPGRAERFGHPAPSSSPRRVRPRGAACSP